MVLQKRKQVKDLEDFIRQWLNALKGSFSKAPENLFRGAYHHGWGPREVCDCLLFAEILLLLTFLFFYCWEELRKEEKKDMTVNFIYSFIQPILNECQPCARYFKRSWWCYSEQKFLLLWDYILIGEAEKKMICQGMINVMKKNKKG